MSSQDCKLDRPIPDIMDVPVPKAMAVKIRAELIERFEASGMTQDEYAAESGVQQSTISNYFLGKKTITVETVNKLASVFSLKAEYTATIKLVAD